MQLIWRAKPWFQGQISFDTPILDIGPAVQVSQYALSGYSHLNLYYGVKETQASNIKRQHN